MPNPADLLYLLASALVVGVALYSYVLALWGRGTTRPAIAASRPLFFAVIVPCLNESAVIGRTLESLLSMRGRFHILVLDDASDDGSPGVIRRFPKHMVDRKSVV